MIHEVACNIRVSPVQLVLYEMSLLTEKNFIMAANLVFCVSFLYFGFLVICCFLYNSLYLSVIYGALLQITAERHLCAIHPYFSALTAFLSGGKAALRMCEDRWKHRSGGVFEHQGGRVLSLSYAIATANYLVWLPKRQWMSCESISAEIVPLAFVLSEVISCEREVGLSRSSSVFNICILLMTCCSVY